MLANNVFLRFNVQGELALTIMGIDGDVTPDILEKLHGLPVRLVRARSVTWEQGLRR